MTGGISLPRSLDLRSLQQSLSQISTRLRALEAALNITTAQAGQTTLSNSQSNASMVNLNARISALENFKFVSAAEVGLRADRAVAIYDVVYASSPTGCATADPSSPTTAQGIIGVAEGAALANGAVTVRRFGAMSITGAGFTPGEAVYWGGSAFTHTPTDGLAILVGVAVSTSTLFVLPSETVLLERGPYTSLESFLPVAYALVQFTVELVETLAGQPDGFVVKIGDELQTRAITSSSASGINVIHGNGVDGDVDLRLA